MATIPGWLLFGVRLLFDGISDIGCKQLAVS